MLPNQPVGVFDSGLGGLSVLREIWQQLPDESTIYLADQANFPYGTRPADEVRAFSSAHARFLRAQGCKAIVVACNTASAAALDHLRAEITDVPIVGMEPALKPAAHGTHSGVVGVLATGATLGAARFEHLLERFAASVQVISIECPELVVLVEAGQADSAPAVETLRAALDGPLARGMDTLVLGCTHFPWLVPAIRTVAGPDLTIIDPAPAVARQVRKVLAEKELLAGPAASPVGERAIFYTTDDAATMQNRLAQMLAGDYRVGATPQKTGAPTRPGRS